MEHKNHCFRCGGKMVDGVCTNTKCQTEAYELPVWPWQFCQGANCRKMGLFCVTRKRDILRFVGLLILGICLLLFGLVFHSKQMIIMGTICIIGWLFSRFTYTLIRKSRLAILKEENVLHKHQDDLNSGEILDTSIEQRRFKIESDKVTSLKSQLLAKLSAHRIVHLITLFLLFTVVVFSNQGKTLPWSLESFKGGAIQSSEDTKNNDVYHDFEGGSSKVEHPSSELHEVDFDKKQIENEVFGAVFPKKNCSQKVRESTWIVLIWLNFFIFLFILFLVIFCAVVCLFFRGSGIGEKFKDNLKLLSKSTWKKLTSLNSRLCNTLTKLITKAKGGE